MFENKRIFRPKNFLYAILAVAAIGSVEVARGAGSPINLAVTTNSAVYAPGDEVAVQAVVTDADGNPITSVRRSTVVIKDPSGKRRSRSSLNDQGGGVFTSAYGLNSSASTGTWTVDVSVDAGGGNRAKSTISFEVSDDPIGCVDADLDGFEDVACGGTDCDDSDATIHPGAPEICGDGIDQDCDGSDEPCACEDADGDGHEDAACGGDDCNDSDPTIYPGAPEVCGDGIDQDCDGSDEPCGCADEDLDGHEDAACGGDDCNDSDPTIYPGAPEICGDGIDQDCDGSDLSCGEGHDGLVWSGSDTCLQCHTTQAHEVHSSVMYQWEGATPDMTSGPEKQGKISGAVNSYCVNILGNWDVCGNCHVGLGQPPTPEATPEQLSNIDCMVCHQDAYRRKKVDGRFVPDEEAMTITMDQAARTVHPPGRYNCLQCHAKAGGGDAVKRGDLTMAQISTTDRNFDVHMATTGGDMRCQECHTFTDHKVAGKGSDLRPTDSADVPECSDCHSNMTTSGGHADVNVVRHIARVACQTCHIPIYAKDAADSPSSEATETHRTWLTTHSTAAPFHPALYTDNDLMPDYRFWNRKSSNYLLHDVAVIDPATGRYPTSRPLGDVADDQAKLFAFKYKTAEQPFAHDQGKLIALDTSVFFATGDPIAATEQGLVNMGLSENEPYSWVETDTFQMLNHQVSTSGAALECNDCHGSTQRMDLQGELGYALKGPQSQVCYQCHGSKGSKPFTELHNKHVSDKGYDCSWCHSFSRPERGLRTP